MELARIGKVPKKFVVPAVVATVALVAFARIPVPTPASPKVPEGITGAASVPNDEEAASIAVSKRVKVAVPRPPPPSALTAQAASGAPLTEARSGAPQLARSGSIELLAPDVERALRDVARSVRANGATVTGMSDERPANEGDVHRASVTVSVPSAGFERMLAALAALGRVRSRSTGAEDVGDKIVDDGARLRNLRRTELDLLKIMDRSGRVSEILDVERELSSVREQIETIDAELADAQHRVARSQINVSLVEDAPIRIVEPELGAQLGAAWHAAIDQVKAFTLATIARTFVIIAFAPYLVGLLLVALAVRIVVRARFRKSAPAAP